LQALRQAQGYSRYAFARALAVTPVTVWRWEQSEGLPTNILKRCAKVLNMAATDIDPELGMHHTTMVAAAGVEAGALSPTQPAALVAVEGA
jgi:transcriptional regulator with XRE-family HTH domain